MAVHSCEWCKEWAMTEVCPYFQFDWEITEASVDQWAPTQEATQIVVMVLLELKIPVAA